MTTPFFVHKSGATAADAFAAAQADGGPIALKTAFRVHATPVNINPDSYARVLVDQNWHHCAETSGPAGCFDLAGDDFLFFGAA